MAERSPSHDPSVQSIEERIPVYDPDWEDATEYGADDDMDFEPANEDPEDEEDDAFEDAEEGLLQTLLEEGSLEVEIQDAEDDEQDDGGGEGEERQAEATRNATGIRTMRLSREQMRRILQQPSMQRLFQVRGSRLLVEDEDEEEEEEDEDYSYSSYGRPMRRRVRREPPADFEPVPNERGTELMATGVFGNNERKVDPIARKKQLAARILRRELGLGTTGQIRCRNALMKHDLIPGTRADSFIIYGARCYSGQFSADGNFFFSCGQDFKVRMYDTSNPYKWKYYKQVSNPYASWTITDASLSSDNRYLAYSSISSIVCLAPTDPTDHSEPRTLDFSRLDAGRGARGYARFAIYSLRFSGDGREIVAGTGDRSVYVFDIERNQSILRIPGHQDDVNAVCFGDAASPHILYSGSDDTTLKVWDRRSLGEGRPAGVFLGHTEGLTYVDSKGDGRYIISNGKEQTAKLWDLRKVIPTDQADKIRINLYTNGFEYRMNAFNFEDWRPHPHDCSLVTFRGHSVLKTLIRCHFSPPGSTDSRYVYSGSSDGKVYVWNLDATLKGTIDVQAATEFLKSRSRDMLGNGFWGGEQKYGTVVRDASWHPEVPMVAATSWNGWGQSLGTCSVHSWNDGLDEDDGVPPMGVRYKSELEPEWPEPEPEQETDTANRSWWSGPRAAR